MAWTVAAMIFMMGAAIELGRAKAPQLQFKSMAKASLPRFKSIVGAPRPQFRQIAGSPEPTDFGCTTTFDAVDLCSMDNNYYYFMGSYLYTIEKLSSNITGPRAVTDFFSGLTLPVLAAFSTGPLIPLMFIIDSSNSTNVKVYKFNSATAYPRSPLSNTSVAMVFRSSRSSLTQSVTAVLSITSPARVYVFGNSSTTTAASFKYNSGAPIMSMFTYVGEVPTGWNATVTSASMWYNMSSGVTLNFLYDNTAKVARVNNTLAIVPPGNAAALSSCPSWVPPQMNGCCTSQSNANATTQNSTASASAPAPSNSSVNGSSGATSNSTASNSTATGASIPASTNSSVNGSSGSTAIGASAPAPTNSSVNGSSGSAASNSTVAGASVPASTNSSVNGSSGSAASNSTASGASPSAAPGSSVIGASTAAANNATLGSSNSTLNGVSAAAPSTSAVNNASSLPSSNSTVSGAANPPAA